MRYFFLQGVIVVNNYIFAGVMLPLIKLIGLPTKTIELRYASWGIFCCLILDMILIPMFIGMDLNEHGMDSRLQFT